MEHICYLSSLARPAACAPPLLQWALPLALQMPPKGTKLGPGGLFYPAELLAEPTSEAAPSTSRRASTRSSTPRPPAVAEAELAAGPRPAPGAAARARRRRRKRSCWCSLLPSRRSLKLYVAFMICFILVFGSGVRILGGVSRMTDALADITQAAGHLVGAGANATVRATNLGVVALSTTSAAVNDLLYGVDLVNVSLHRTSAKAFAVSSASLQHWLIARGPFPEPVANWFSKSLDMLSGEVPHLELQDDIIKANGTYWMMWARLRRRSDSSVAAAMVVVSAHFNPIWSNPAWELLGCEIATQSVAILAEFRAAIAELPPVPASLFAVDDAALARDFSLPVPAAPRLRRLLALFLFSALAGFCVVFIFARGKFARLLAWCGCALHRFLPLHAGLAWPWSVDDANFEFDFDPDLPDGWTEVAQED